MKVKETLTRIGVASKKDKTLFQSCHILHKQGKYAIVHFKELFLLDGKKSDFTDEDKARRNTIANLLSEWDLIDLVDPEKTDDPVVPIGDIKIITWKEKPEWTLVPKYSIGKKSNVSSVYGVGGEGTWSSSATTEWAKKPSEVKQAVPTNVEDVIYDGNTENLQDT